MSESQRRPFDVWSWIKAQMALMPLLVIAGAGALSMADARYDARYDERYVQTAALSNAVQTIQLSQNEQIIVTIDTQLQIAHRRQDSAVTPQEKNQYADEIRVLEGAREAAIRARQKIFKGD